MIFDGFVSISMNLFICSSGFQPLSIATDCLIFDVPIQRDHSHLMKPSRLLIAAGGLGAEMMLGRFPGFRFAIIICTLSLRTF